MLAGGSVTCTSLACLQQQQYEVSKQTMELLNDIGQMKTNPVILDNSVYGLLRAMRTEWLQAKTALHLLEADGTGGVYADDSEKNKKAVHDLETKLLDEELKCVKSEDEKRQLQARVAELRENYVAAVQKAAKAHEDLINSESERLKVSQCLVTLQLKHTEMQNGLSEERFKEMTKAVTSEQDLVDLTLLNKKQREDIDKLTAVRKDLEKELHNVESELLAAYFFTSQHKILNCYFLYEAIFHPNTDVTSLSSATPNRGCSSNGRAPA